MQKPLLLKLTLLALVVTLLSTGVATFFISFSAREALRDRYVEDLASDARVAAFFLARGDFDDFQLLVYTLGEELDRQVTVVDSAGVVVADSGSEFDETDMVAVEVPLQQGGVVRLALPERVVTDELMPLYRAALLVVALALLLATGTAFAANRAITDPLNEMLYVTKRLQNGEFGRRVLVKSRDELGQLGRAFNELSKTLEEMFDTIHDRESKLNAVLSSMDDGVLAVNLNGQVILANRAVGELRGIDEDLLIGRDLTEVIQSDELSDVIAESINHETSTAKEIKLLPKSERTLSVNVSPLEGEDNAIIGAVAVLRDVTNLRRLERMRREFVANVSHELRTPLTSIKGFVETLLNGKLDDPELLERFLKIVNGETDRMIALINDLLDLSRIESGRIAVTFEEVNIRQVFDDTIMILQAKAEEKGVLVENRIREDVMVFGDAKLLKQVAVNLVDNGIKYNQDGGMVWVDAELHEDDDEVEIIVSDSGVGIPEEHIDRVFERFYRVDKGRSRSMGGTGLGLSIVRHIIERHNGTIQAQSREDQGTEICFTLRLVD